MNLKYLKESEATRFLVNLELSWEETTFDSSAWLDFKTTKKRFDLM